MDGLRPRRRTIAFQTKMLMLDQERDVSAKRGVAIRAAPALRDSANRIPLQVDDYDRCEKNRPAPR
jgi:hypothetical protein